jgi:hypothetical protein
MTYSEKWAGDIRAEMARKQIYLKDLARAITIKGKHPSIATLSRWVKGNCTIEVAHQIERAIDNWEQP